MKKISLFVFSFFILLSALFFWEKVLPKKYSILSFHQELKKTKKSVVQNPNINPQLDMAKKTNSSKGLAYAEIIKNPKTGAEEVKAHLPPGKRLYNEEKMNEIATNANIEYQSNER